MWLKSYNSPGDAKEETLGPPGGLFIKSNNMLQVVKPRSLDDIDTCVKMYLSQNDESFIPASYEKAYHILNQLVKRNKFVRMALNSEDEIIGWIYGDIGEIPHVETRVMEQKYFTTNQEGIGAVRVIKLLHNALIQEAVSKDIKLITSHGNHLDENNVFVKILEKQGWERRGYLAIYKPDNTY